MTVRRAIRVQWASARRYGRMAADHRTTNGQCAKLSSRRTRLARRLKSAYLRRAAPNVEQQAKAEEVLIRLFFCFLFLFLFLFFICMTM
jgi:hypothetical protein